MEKINLETCRGAPVFSALGVEAEKLSRENLLQSYDIKPRFYSRKVLDESKSWMEDPGKRLFFVGRIVHAGRCLSAVKTTPC